MVLNVEICYFWAPFDSFRVSGLGWKKLTFSDFHSPAEDDSCWPSPGWKKSSRWFWEIWIRRWRFVKVTCTLSRICITMILAEGRRRLLFNWRFFASRELSIEVFARVVKVNILKKIDFEYRAPSFFSTFWLFSSIKVLPKSKKPTTFLAVLYKEKHFFFTEIVMERLNMVVIEKYDFNMELCQNSHHFLQFLHDQDSNGLNKMECFFLY